MADVMIGKTNITGLLTKKYKRLGTGWVTLLQIPADKHMEVNEEAVRILINVLGYNCVYITLGKSCIELDKKFKAKGVDTNNLYFIDAISQMYGESLTDAKRYNYVSGPLDIDSITATLHQTLATLQGQKACVFLDSVTTVLLYNSIARTIRFSQFLTRTLKEMHVTGVMVSVAKGDTTKKLFEELTTLCDETIEISGDEKQRPLK
jgi:KaiC/GvpD/RAD55 family RecA-like ATPase